MLFWIVQTLGSRINIPNIAPLTIHFIEIYFTLRPTLLLTSLKLLKQQFHMVNLLWILAKIITLLMRDDHSFKRLSGKTERILWLTYDHSRY